MIVHRVKQGSLEWHMARAGVISASHFKTIRERVGGLTAQQSKYVEAIRSGMSEVGAMAAAGYKARPKAEAVERALDGMPTGDYSEKAKNLAFRLACERIAKAPIEGDDYIGWQADRGIALEPKARMEHELRYDVLVEEVGFVTTDDGRFGASADGFIGDDEGAEYKCFLAPDKLRAIYLTGDVSDVIDQCDGGLWITHRKVWNFGLYCPALAPIGLDFVLHRIQRDDDRIGDLELDLVAFDRLVEEYRAALLHRAKVGLPAPEPAAVSAPWSGPDELAAPRAEALARGLPPAANTNPTFGGVALLNDLFA